MSLGSKNMSEAHNLRELRRVGITVLEGVFDRETVAMSREQVLRHCSLYKNTRPTASSRHLAGFHRYPELDSLHNQLVENKKILDFMTLVVGCKQVRSIGLSDITINRSQHWHKDLLRGKYAAYLKGLDVWDCECPGVYKLLMYLQDGRSLKIVPGSHRVPLSLESDEYAEPGDDADVADVSFKAGDVVVMDIRTSHRGSTEEVFLSRAFDDDPKILLSTALGVDASALTNAMELGNARRLRDWDERYRATKSLASRQSHVAL